MTFDERVRALEPLGFTPRQTRFLVLVALHSGYCLRRQYLAFAGVKHGKNARAFFAQLVSRELAEPMPCRADRGNVYHVRARAIYRHLEHEDHRNRRTASAALIARKVMCLDYVLGQPDVHWLATDDEKVAYFASTHDVAHDELPQREQVATDPCTGLVRRYFTQKLPIFLTGHPPTAHFVALVLDPAARTLELFLADHARLLSQLPAWVVVAIAPAGAPALSACLEAFGRHVHPPVQPVVPGPDLRWYLVTRRQVDAKDFSRLSVADLNRFRQLRAVFATVAHETLYADWIREGEAALARSVGSHQPPPVGRLVVHALPFRYTQFGSLPGVA